MLNRKLLIHIPHSKLEFPKIFYDGLLIDKEKIMKENIFISDYLVDLFLPSNYNNIIMFPYSRLFCDVERFKNYELESMSKYGMGVIYTNDSNGNIFLKYNNEYRQNILDNYYNPYHKNLDDKVTDIIKKNRECYILDLHSFSDEFVYKLFKYVNTPDICIGYEKDNLDKMFLEITVNHFKCYNYTLQLNYPYSGSIIPNKYYGKKNEQLKTIMIEINKRIYLKNNLELDKVKYLKLKECMDKYYEIIEEYLINKENKTLKLKLY